MNFRIDPSTFAVKGNGKGIDGYINDREILNHIGISPKTGNRYRSEKALTKDKISQHKPKKKRKAKSGLYFQDRNGKFVGVTHESHRKKVLWKKDKVGYYRYENGYIVRK